MKNKYTKVRSGWQQPSKPARPTRDWEMASPTLNSSKEVVLPPKTIL